MTHTESILGSRPAHRHYVTALPWRHHINHWSVTSLGSPREHPMTSLSTTTTTMNHHWRGT